MKTDGTIKVFLILFAVLWLAACGGGGGGGAGGPTGAPPNNIPRFAYAANFFDNSVSIYAVNAETGQLRHNGYVAAGANPRSVTVDPSGQFAYVANAGSDNVSAYTLNATTGALTSIGAAVAAGTDPVSVSVDPSGKFAYVANQNSNNVSAYTLNATTGALTARPTVAGRNGNLAMAMTKGTTAVTYAPKFAYVANEGSDNVTTFSINPTTGALTEVGTEVAAGDGPISIVILGVFQ